MSTPTILCLALLLDALLGEPRWLWSRLPHPAIVMGKLIGWGDRRLNFAPSQKVKGTAFIAALVIAMACLGYAISCFGWLPQVILAAILLAQRSLVEHVAAVSNGLRQSLGEGRRAVAMIVSRDTGDMDTSAVARSAIESGAENLSDGVIAPAFWFLVGGLPGLLAYKVVNTADSMIGYRTPKHEQFGWAAARLDDLLNWVPARLTALLIAATHEGLRAWLSIRSDAIKHRSPNAGWPEAAMARAIDAAIAGPRTYDGALREFPFVNKGGRKTLDPDDIDATCHALWRTWAAFLGLTFVLIPFS
ncbi:adenosylcobinamide-phosphate synthase [Shimia gijangensis]|uniref:Cobalamin biosynthesis protein CobD n=1 Tax=Shimia gijangensis TaxID=1470563 RepID=A0A1M6BH88_9RHOB|nr:adenosylcobinamide-phosphate synthase CbiB [Shimia gijangensis]SHI47948.1 adenosylcobinamide-phosphate synthase [Shimia gijangensis]